MRILKYSLALALGITIGTWSAKTVLSKQLDRAAVHNGPWRTLLATGDVDSDMYERAAIAVGGLLALSKQETLYYTATEDSNGLALEENCTYHVLGIDPDARWWSLTAYAADHFLPQNTDNALSVSKTTVDRDKDGLFDIIVSANPSTKNWISSRSAGNYSLTLRLYNPNTTVYESPQSVELPSILRGSCQ
jgi:hypothetical protein